MINSHLIQTHNRNSLAARDVLSKKPLAVIALLVLVLATALAGSPPAFAESQQRAATSGAMAVAGQVNINSADAETLAKNLRGVGATRALEIVRHRETYGPFASADELAEVKGIGQATLDRNRDLITLE